MNNKKNQNKFSKNNNINKTKSLNTISFLKIPKSLSFRVNNSKTLNEKNKKMSFKKLIYSNLHKYNINDNEYNIMKINDLVDSKSSRLIAIFKDYLINDYIEEFLNRFYKIKESKTRIPKFSDYYKNYLKFFCNPTFSDFFANEIIQDFGEAKAEIYYNKNYGHKNKEKKNESNKETVKTIFDTIVKESIDYMIKDTKDYFTTLSPQETINLPDDTILIINGVNKNSNENSISSILNCFSDSNIKKNNKKNKNNEKKNNDKKLINPNSIVNNIYVNRAYFKSNSNIFKPISTIQTYGRIYSENKNNLKKQKDLKISHIEVSNSQNNFNNKIKNKDISNGKIISTQISNSNFSRNKNKLQSHNSNSNNKILLTSSPLIRKKKKSSDNIIKDNKNNINSNKKNENINIKDILKLYNDKTKNINNNINNNIINKDNNNKENNNTNRIIHHKHTHSSPIINNFNINLNNHNSLQNINSNKNINSSNNLEIKNSLAKNNNNSRNKAQIFIRVNTDSQKKLNPYSTSSNFHHFSSNINNDLEYFIKNKLFSSYNEIKVEKLKKENNNNKNNQEIKIKNIYNSPLQNKTNINSIYEQLQRSNNLFSPDNITKKGLLTNNNHKTNKKKNNIPYEKRKNN